MKDMPAAEAVIPPQPRDYHGFNWAGFGTLYAREVRRFWKVGMQTLAAPVVTALLYMMVFVVAVRGAAPPIHGTPFAVVRRMSAGAWPRWAIPNIIRPAP